MESNKHIYLPMLTVSEAAKFLGVGRKMIYQLIEPDKLKHVIFPPPLLKPSAKTALYIVFKGFRF